MGVGPIRLERPAAWNEIVGLSERDEVLLGCVDPRTEQRMKEAVDHAYRTGDTIGGIFEVVAHGVPPGLGSHIAWDTRLDGRLAQAIVSIQAVKGVEIGYSPRRARRLTAQPSRTRSITTREDRNSSADRIARAVWKVASQTEQDLVVRGFLKPISTLRTAS